MKATSLLALTTAACTALISTAALASSHREAPSITSSPRVDGTDFYMFRSYETGREGYVTLLANYLPLQDAYGGPNYFRLDPSALYEIHIDNNGDALEDITFQFRFNEQVQGLSLPIGPSGQTVDVAVPLTNMDALSIPAAGGADTTAVIVGDFSAGNDAVRNCPGRHWPWALFNSTRA